MTMGRIPESPAVRRAASDVQIARRSPATRGAIDAPPLVSDVLGRSGQALDPSIRSVMEAAFGQDFSGVRVHTDRAAAQSARAIGASAYTLGDDIVFGAGQYAPGTDPGDRLVAHELTHVIQHGGQPRPAPSSLHVGDAGDPAEHAAEATAAAITSTASATRAGPRPAIAATTVPCVRRQTAPERPAPDQPRPGSAAWMAAQHVPLARSVEQTHWASPAERAQFIREYLDYASSRPELHREYEEGVAAYGAPAAAGPSGAGPSGTGAQGTGPPGLGGLAAAIREPRYAERRPARTVRTITFLHFGSFSEGLVTAELPGGTVQTGPDPSAGYNFDTYLVNGRTGQKIAAQSLGGTRYRVFMGSPECPGCHFGHGLEVDLLGDNPTWIMLPTIAEAATAMAQPGVSAAERQGTATARAGGTGPGPRPPADGAPVRPPQQPSGPAPGPGPAPPGPGSPPRGPAPPPSPPRRYAGFTAEGPMVSVPATRSGAPARVLEIGAGPADTNLGLPPRPGSATAPDPHLVEVRRTDINARPGVDHLDANQRLPQEFVGRYDTVIINNPRGYVPDIENIGQAVRPGGRIIVQGKGETYPGQRGINPDFQRLMQRPVPPGFRIVDGAPEQLTRPESALGHGFHRTTGGPVNPPNFRIIYERIQ
jgi:hypothetical protein